MAYKWQCQSQMQTHIGEFDRQAKNLVIKSQFSKSCEWFKIKRAKLTLDNDDNGTFKDEIIDCLNQWYGTDLSGFDFLVQ